MRPAAARAGPRGPRDPRSKLLPPGPPRSCYTTRGAAHAVPEMMMTAIDGTAALAASHAVATQDCASGTGLRRHLLLQSHYRSQTITLGEGCLIRAPFLSQQATSNPRTRTRPPSPRVCFPDLSLSSFVFRSLVSSRCLSFWCHSGVCYSGVTQLSFRCLSFRCQFPLPLLPTPQNNPQNLYRSRRGCDAVR